MADRIRQSIQIDASTGCWNWQKHVKRDGYARVFLDGRMILAHRAAYEALKGSVPAGKQLDHVCRNRRCVNPDHLEPVDARTNVLRGESFAARNAAKTRCAHGHPFDDLNTSPRASGGRACRACARAATRRYLAKKRSTAA